MILPTENQGPPDHGPSDQIIKHFQMRDSLIHRMPGLAEILKEEQIMVVAIVLVEQPKAIWHIALTRYFKEQGIANPDELSLAINSFLL